MNDLDLTPVLDDFGKDWDKIDREAREKDRELDLKLAVLIGRLETLARMVR